jgi:hypothetical protein
MSDVVLHPLRKFPQSGVPYLLGMLVASGAGVRIHLLPSDEALTHPAKTTQMLEDEPSLR